MYDTYLLTYFYWRISISLKLCLYLVAFVRYAVSNNSVTLNSGLEVGQGRRKWRQITICLLLGKVSAIFSYTLVFGAPVRGLHRNIAITFEAEKLQWWAYPAVKKIEDIYNHFDRIPACDRRTKEQTDILPQHSPRYAYASRGKNRNFWPRFRFISEMIQNRTIVTMEGELETVYPSFRMVPFPIILSDPWPGFQGHDITERQITRKWYKIELYLQRQTNIKSYMFYRTAPLSTTLNDPWPRFQGHASIWRWISIQCLKCRLPRYYLSRLYKINLSLNLVACTWTTVHLSWMFPKQ